MRVPSARVQHGWTAARRLSRAPGAVGASSCALRQNKGHTPPVRLGLTHAVLWPCLSCVAPTPHLLGDGLEGRGSGGGAPGDRSRPFARSQHTGARRAGGGWAVETRDVLVASVVVPPGACWGCPPRGESLPPTTLTACGPLPVRCTPRGTHALRMGPASAKPASAPPLGAWLAKPQPPHALCFGSASGAARDDTKIS